MAEFYQRCFGARAAGMRGQRRAELTSAVDGSMRYRRTNRKPQAAQGSADRAVQAGGRRLPARDRAQARARSRVCGRAAGPRWRQGAPAGAAAQAQPAGGGDRARPRRFDGAAARLPRPGVHRRLRRGGQQARAVFEAVEQARVEAIGARRMAGRGANLAAMLDDRFHRGKFDEITDRADAPIEDALAMIVRERLTGAAAAAGRAQAGRSVAPVDRGARRRATSTGSSGASRTSAASPMPSTTCSTRSTWATTAAATPRTRRTRAATSRAARTSRRATARPRSPTTPRA